MITSNKPLVCLLVHHQLAHVALSLLMAWKVPSLAADRGDDGQWWISVPTGYGRLLNEAVRIAGFVRRACDTAPARDETRRLADALRRAGIPHSPEPEQNTPDEHGSTLPTDDGTTLPN